MKVIIIVFGLIFIGYHTQIKAQANQGYVLTGQFSGLPNGTKVYLTTQENDTVAKTISKGDRFVFEGKLLNNGRFHFIVLDALISKVMSKAIFVTNDTIEVKGKIGDTEINVLGSKDHELFRSILPVSKANVDSVRKINRKYDEVKIKEKEALQSGDKVLVEKYKNESEQLIKMRDRKIENYKLIVKNWVLEHRGSLYAPYAVKNTLLTMANVSEVIGLFNKLDKEAQSSYYGFQLLKEIEALNFSKNVVKGNPLPNFSVFDTNGEKLFIQDIVRKNKITLIACWASWCSPYRAEIPDLKKIYDKYKQAGLGIVDISSDKEISSWKKAIREDSTEWFHCIEDKAGTVNSILRIKAIPAYIMVDNKGKMLAFQAASDIENFGGDLKVKSLDEKLAELLGTSK